MATMVSYFLPTVVTTALDPELKQRLRKCAHHFKIVLVAILPDVWDYLNMDMTASLSVKLWLGLLEKSQCDIGNGVLVDIAVDYVLL